MLGYVSICRSAGSTSDIAGVEISWAYGVVSRESTTGILSKGAFCWSFLRDLGIKIAAFGLSVIACGFRAFCKIKVLHITDAVLLLFVNFFPYVNFFFKDGKWL